MATTTPRTTAEARIRAPRRTVTGMVISDKMMKTITVRTSRKVKHPVYGKYVTRYVSYKAHDEGRKAKLGDTVEIAFARRLSKTKNWTLVRIVSAARVVAVRGEEELASLPGKAPAPVPAAKAPASDAPAANAPSAVVADAAAPEVSS